MSDVEKQVAFLDGGHETERVPSTEESWSLATYAAKWFSKRQSWHDKVKRMWSSKHHRRTTKKEMPGLHVSVLMEMFGESVQYRGLEKGAAGTSKGVVLEENNNIKWSKKNVELLVENLKDGVISRKDTDGKTLIHHAIISGALDCAKLMFDYAAEEKIVVDLCWQDGNILEWSVDNYSKESVQFVLERMTERCATVKQTTQVLTSYLPKLLDTFPTVIQKFIVDDLLCFEFGRFKVPKSIFKGTDEKPIGMICDNENEDPEWEAEDSEKVKELWETHCPELTDRLQQEDEEQITAVSKFAIVEDLAVGDHQQSIVASIERKCSMNVFESETVRANVQWKWHKHLRKIFVFSNAMFLISMLCFCCFATFYGDVSGAPASFVGRYRPGNDISRDHKIAQISICCSFGFLMFPLVIQPTSYIWLFFSGTETCLFLLVHAFMEDRHTMLSAVVVSIHCMIILFKTLQYLRPFRWFGPFVTMTYYVLRDIIPFMFIGAIVVVKFGIGLFVLLGRSFQQHDETFTSDMKNNTNTTSSQDAFAEQIAEKEIVDEMIKVHARSFRTIWRVFEYLLYTISGQFDPSVFHLSRSSFMSAWISVFFSVFLLLAAIVLLSLLISVLGNTFDRVVLHEEAEFIKHRAYCIAAFDRINLRWKAVESCIRTVISCGSYSSPLKFRYSGKKLTSVKNVSIFHYLVPSERAVVCDDTAWHGRVHEVIKTTRAGFREQEEKERLETEKLKNEVDEIKGQIATLQAEFRDHAASMDKALRELLNRLPGGSQNEGYSGRGGINSLPSESTYQATYEPE